MFCAPRTANPYQIDGHSYSAFRANSAPAGPTESITLGDSWTVVMDGHMEAGLAAFGGLGARAVTFWVGAGFPI